jgi:hypothetical protein
VAIRGHQVGDNIGNGCWRKNTDGDGSGDEEVAQFIMAATEPACRSWALESAHRLVTTFEARVILFQAIVELAARRLCLHRRTATVMAILEAA